MKCAHTFRRPNFRRCPISAIDCPVFVVMPPNTLYSGRSFVLNAARQCQSTAGLFDVSTTVWLIEPRTTSLTNRVTVSIHIHTQLTVRLYALIGSIVWTIQCHGREFGQPMGWVGLRWIKRQQFTILIWRRDLTNLSNFCIPAVFCCGYVCFTAECASDTV